MKSLCTLSLLFFSFWSYSQTNTYTLVDNKMNAIPLEMASTTTGIANYIQANFKTDEDKIRAVFFWLATNVSYDIKNMMADNSAETSLEKTENTLKTKKGVCIHYAEVFHSITNQLGIKNRIIEGFVKANGKIESLSHAWCAAKINEKWYFFDPTWGAGGIINGVFVKKLNNNYFKVSPIKMTSSHLPFDYLWQFMDYPLTYDEFISGKISDDKAKKKFDFESEITKYDSLLELDQLHQSVARIEKSGFKSPVVVQYLNIHKKNLLVARNNYGVQRMNSISDQYNQGIALLNDLIFYRNNKFKPTLPDEELEKMAKLPKEILEKCQEDAYSVVAMSDENSADFRNLKRMIGAALKSSEEQRLFMEEYLRKSKIGRKMMFSKISWGGIN